MRNPYEPPKAPVRDAAGPPRLPRAVRILRAVAVAGSAFFGLLALGAFGARPQAAVFFFACGMVLLSCTSIAALVSRRAERKVYWAAMLLNSIAVVLLNLVAAPGTLTFIVPALLNMTAIELLRRARARLA